MSCWFLTSGSNWHQGTRVILENVKLGLVRSILKMYWGNVMSFMHKEQCSLQKRKGKGLLRAWIWYHTDACPKYLHWGQWSYTIENRCERRRRPWVSTPVFQTPESSAASIQDWAYAHTHAYTRFWTSLYLHPNSFPICSCPLLQSHSLESGILAAVPAVSVVMRLVRM